MADTDVNPYRRGSTIFLIVTWIEVDKFLNRRQGQLRDCLEQALHYE